MYESEYKTSVVIIYPALPVVVKEIILLITMTTI